jgi:hypothetical protein
LRPWRLTRAVPSTITKHSEPLSPSFTIVVPAATRLSSDRSATFWRVFAGTRRAERDLVTVINEPVVASPRESYGTARASTLFVIAEPGLNTSVSVGPTSATPDPLILTKVTFGPGSIRPTHA